MKSSLRPSAHAARHHPVPLACAALACALALPLVAHAQALQYPTKPIRIIVGFAPGGATDLTARLVGQQLTESWKQPVLVENRPGASGMIGAELVARAAPDGYTLIMATQTSHAVAPSLYRKIAYDPVKDFAPITVAASSPLLLVVHPSMPVRTVKELVSLAKARPGELSFASGGIGTSPHMAAELLNSMAGTKIVHIPYKGEAPGLADVLGGQVPMMFSNVPTSLPHVKSGKLRALAVSGAKRSSLAPEFPTVAESGLTGFEVLTWFGMFAPAATPRDIVAKLNAEIVRALNAPDVRAKIAAQGLEIVANTPEQFAAYQQSEIVKWAKVVKESGARAD
jgi:tripartite-type tricarboxylate transporter receptor subunit TctC